MTYSEFLTHLSTLSTPIILLEGTRQLPSEHGNSLMALGKKLAIDLPDARFRTGNASGSDDASADGVSQVAPASIGIFYLNPDNPMQGGTAHTWRVCELYNVPTVAQINCLTWLDDLVP